MSSNEPVVKGAFSYTDAMLDALETSLSPERMTAYLCRTGGDRERALRLYTWNTAVSAAFYGPLQGLEVALRNAVHRELSAKYGADWYDNSACDLDAGTQARIAAARADLLRDRYVDDPPHMVAALSFGFWVGLLGAGGRLSGFGKANYEMTLWRPALYRAFRFVKINRKNAHAPLDYLRTFRNRIAHHEPVLDRHLAKDYASILQVAGWISPHTQTWISHHSRVPALLSQSPDDPNLMF
ncbi:Abi family protein [Rhodoblastus acidophilus]|uniref:Abi family protein n=1 Tax=Candidatus Rhodoblastus alkanivorans TaxID=2954117 RepID=A0ABS9Z2A4_9HYPH|nr:Abi family protein [Candidatus Rhodoblastus alkanivorans]MCI4679002.1 Abi family protein [Candidatus Rhodoblastus alkanivorans]MCI4681743.1 Abi family protein [Candidatus Rhodoblastus alkanivorans]MDI4642792.1 Abi family protein [Rhodoblastus acidophilus]